MKTWYAKNSNPPREVVPSVGRRQAAEWAVVSAFVRTALKAGHTIGVFDGEDTVLRYSSSYRKIMAAIMSTDEDYILVYPVGATSGERIGWVRCIYGNDGPDVISDYTCNLGEDDGKGLNLMKEADAVANKMWDRI